ncbi:hypothetical protein ACJX0J_007250 [Zea mays]
MGWMHDCPLLSYVHGLLEKLFFGQVEIAIPHNMVYLLVAHPTADLTILEDFMVHLQDYIHVIIGPATIGGIQAGAFKIVHVTADLLALLDVNHLFNNFYAWHLGPVRFERDKKYYNRSIAAVIGDDDWIH